MSKNMNDYNKISKKLNEMKEEYLKTTSKRFADDDQDMYHSIKSISKQLDSMDKNKKFQLLIALATDDDISAIDILETLISKTAQLEFISKLAADIFDDEGGQQNE